MEQDPNPDRLRALEGRIERLKGKGPVKRPNTGVVFSQGEVAWRMVVELVTGMVLGLAIGFGLDVVFNTRPIFLVIFSLLGFGAGIRVMLGTARQMANDAETSASDERD
jgi:ATP synthase protein I